MLLKRLEKEDPQNIDTTFTAALIHTLASNNASALFNIESSLTGGMNVIWFSFNWFDRLCKDNNFIALMQKYKAASRCARYGMEDKDVAN